MRPEQVNGAERAQERPSAFAQHGVGLSPDGKAAFVINALAEKKERVREAATEQRFCPDRACASLDMLAQIIARLEEKNRNLFVDVVAIPLMAREPMDLLKITLATKSLEELSEMSLRPDRYSSSFMTKMRIDRMGRDLSNGQWDPCMQGEMLPLASRAIVYFLEPSAEPHREVVRERLRAMSDVITKSRMLRDAPEVILSQTRSMYVDCGDGRSHDYLGVVVAGYLTLVVEPLTSPAQLASTFVHEDLHLLFEKHYGEEAGELRATRSADPTPVPKGTPLVAANNRIVAGLLSEFHSYVQQAAFDHQLLADGQMSGRDSSTFIMNWKGLRDDLEKALTILRGCEEKGDFTERGSTLLQEMAELFETTSENILKQKEKMMVAILRERLGMPLKKDR